MATFGVGLFFSLAIFFKFPRPLDEIGLCIEPTGDCAKTLGEVLEFDRELCRLDFFPVDFRELPIDLIDSFGENIFPLVFELVLVVFLVM